MFYSIFIVYSHILKNLRTMTQVCVSLFSQLLREYDSLMKEHEGAKVHFYNNTDNKVLCLLLLCLCASVHKCLYLQNNLVSTENKLVDANDQISELKR